MTAYLTDHMSRIDRDRILRDAADGIPILTVEDFIRLTGGDPEQCDKHDYARAKADLRALGYRERDLALWGCRPIFRRWEKVSFSSSELVERWGDDFCRRNFS